MEKTIAKTVSAFMNSDGGTLLIGVGDNGDILGLQQDFKAIQKPTQDQFGLHFTNIITEYLGKENRLHVKLNFTPIDEHLIAVVTIPARSPREVYILGGKEFYVRMGNSSRSLNIRETQRYIQAHWGTLLTNKIPHQKSPDSGTPQKNVTAEQHLNKIENKKLKDMATELREAIKDISTDIVEKTTFQSIIFRTTFDIIGITTRKNYFWLDVKMPKDEVNRNEFELSKDKNPVWIHIRVKENTNFNSLVEVVIDAYERNL